MNIQLGQTWKYGNKFTLTVIRVEDWVNRFNPEDKGTTVWYMVDGRLKSKPLEEFLYLFQPM